MAHSAIPHQAIAPPCHSLLRPASSRAQFPNSGRGAPPRSPPLPAPPAPVARGLLSPPVSCARAALRTGPEAETAGALNVFAIIRRISDIRRFGRGDARTRLPESEHDVPLSACQLLQDGHDWTAGQAPRLAIHSRDAFQFRQYAVYMFPSTPLSALRLLWRPAPQGWSVAATQQMDPARLAVTILRPGAGGRTLRFQEASRGPEVRARPENRFAEEPRPCTALHTTRSVRPNFSEELVSSGIRHRTNGPMDGRRHDACLRPDPEENVDHNSEHRHKRSHRSHSRSNPLFRHSPNCSFTKLSIFVP